MNAQAYLDQHRQRFLDELVDFLSIPSVSALPQHAQDVTRAAEWVAARLKAAGVPRAEVLPTGGHPVVYGEWLGAPGKPTVLVYGHFDTQPADPYELWSTPPFQPTLRDGRIYARGASDDKGNMLITILAAEAFLKTEGKLPLNVKFIFEGQEEIGSPQLRGFIQEHRDLLEADAVINADGGNWDEDQPAINVGCRGLAGVQIDVRGARSDLHSGVDGGAIPNPLHALTQILSSMRSADGKILVAGFYDRVRPVTDRERRQLREVPFDEVEYLADRGVDASFGEPGYSVLERRWLRPTLEVNGIWGGFQGDGVKTVLPNEAHAKVTCRLVPDQEPEDIIARLEAHVRAHAPAGVKVTVTPFAGRARPYLLPADHPAVAAAHEALAEGYGRPPLYIRSGGTVPVTEMFSSLLGLESITVAFGTERHNIHAPNEFFPIAAFEKGQRIYAALWPRLAERLG